MFLSAFKNDYNVIVLISYSLRKDDVDVFVKFFSVQQEQIKAHLCVFEASFCLSGLLSLFMFIHSIN